MCKWLVVVLFLVLSEIAGQHIDDLVAKLRHLESFVELREEPFEWESMIDMD